MGKIAEGGLTLQSLLGLIPFSGWEQTLDLGRKTFNLSAETQFGSFCRFHKFLWLFIRLWHFGHLHEHA